MASWKDVNGKTIWFKTKDGNLFESLVIADPKIGVSIKPLDPGEVFSKEPRGWHVPPNNPNFFFVCTYSTEKKNPANFNRWIDVLAEDKKYFIVEDLTSSFSFLPGSCVFA